MKAIDRFYEYLAEKSLKPTAIEKEMGLSNGYLSAQKKRGADIGEGMMNKIIDYCRDINPEWLLTGNGDMIKTNQTSKSLAPNNIAPRTDKGSNKDGIRQENATDILLSIIQDKDNMIREQAEEIGRLRERELQLERMLEKNVSGAATSTTAGVG